jgi:hypothetical protein
MPDHLPGENPIQFLKIYITDQLPANLAREIPSVVDLPAYLYNPRRQSSLA